MLIERALLRQYEQIFMLIELIGTVNWYWEIPGWGGGGGAPLPYISHIDMCRPKGYGFCAFSGWNQLWFSREQRECMFQFQMNRGGKRDACMRIRNAF